MFPQVIYKTPISWGIEPQFVDVYKAEELIHDIKRQGEGWNNIDLANCDVYRLDDKSRNQKSAIYSYYNEEWVCLTHSDRKGYYELAR